MSPEITLIVPCLNEESNVAELASRFFRAAELNSCVSEAIFIDDGSTDTTLLKLREIEALYLPMVKIVSNHRNLGIASSWAAGLDRASGQVVTFLDADLQNAPEDVFRLLAVLRTSQSDLVRGVRVNSTGIRDPRFVMSKVLNWLLNYAFRMNSRDNKSGFIVVKRPLAQQLIKSHEKFRYFQTFIGVAAHSLGFRTVEIEILSVPRRSGNSFLHKRWIKVTFAVLREFPLARRTFSPRSSQLK